MENKKYYVTMTDKFLSDWGRAEGKKSKYVVICDTIQQAIKARDRAELREEMKYINILYEKPYYTPSRYLVEFVKIEDASYFQ